MRPIELMAKLTFREIRTVRRVAQSRRAAQRSGSIKAVVVISQAGKHV